MTTITLILKIIAWISLLLLVAAPACFLADGMELPQVKTTLLIATIIWFTTAPLGFKPKSKTH